MIRSDEIKNYGIILFDGECNLCTSAVQFILKRDKRGRFKFASMQSQEGRELMKDHGIRSDGPGSFVLIEGDRVRVRSDAALRVAEELSGLWPASQVLRIIPKAIRDFGYNTLAKNRYKLFGRADRCLMPSKEIMDRFNIH